MRTRALLAAAFFVAALPAGAAAQDAPRNVVYLIDGVRTDYPDGPVREGHPMFGIAPERIASITVLRCEQATRIAPGSADGLVIVRTHGAPDDGLQLPPPRHLGSSSATATPATCDGTLSRRAIDGMLDPARPGAARVYLVDGTVATRAAVLAIPPADIASMGISRGAALVDRYGPDAANGVLVVVTRSGPR